MKKLLMMVWSTVFSSVGWWVGAQIGTMTAFMVSMVGMGFGLWYGRRQAIRLESGE